MIMVTMHMERCAYMLHTDLRVHGVHFDYRTKLLIQDHFVIDTDALKKLQKCRGQDIIF